MPLSFSSSSSSSSSFTQSAAMPSSCGLSVAGDVQKDCCCCCCCTNETTPANNNNNKNIFKRRKLQSTTAKEEQEEVKKVLLSDNDDVVVVRPEEAALSGHHGVITPLSCSSSSNSNNHNYNNCNYMQDDATTTITAPTACQDILAEFQQQQQQQQQPQKPLSRLEIQELLRSEASYHSCSSPENGAAAAAAPTTTTGKRSTYLSWDDYFMAVVALSAARSKDPVTAAGCCIVDIVTRRIIAIGYNGFPAGCSDDCLPWASNDTAVTTTNITSTETDSTTTTRRRRLAWLHTKAPYVVHAEVNAILNKCSANVAGAALYCRQFPCHECAKVIVQSRIALVVYQTELANDNPDPDLSYSATASRILLKMGGVTVRKYQPSPTTARSIHLPFVVQKETHDQSGNSSSNAVGSKDDSSSTGAMEAAYRHRDLLLREANYDPVAVLERVKRQQASQDAAATALEDDAPTTMTTPTRKRLDYLSWDEYFMSMAFLTALRSKDPNTQVGACIVDPKTKRILALGYNGFPLGASDDDLPWAREAPNPLHTKYMYVCHAEVNAILNKCSADLAGAVLYVKLFPCNECAKLILQAGIRKVVYLDNPYHDSDSCRASRILFEMAGVELCQFQPRQKSITISLQNDTC